MLSIPPRDALPDLSATDAVYKLFECESHGLGATGDYASIHKSIHRSRKIVIYSRHQLSHASSVPLLQCETQCRVNSEFELRNKE